MSSCPSRAHHGEPGHIRLFPIAEINLCCCGEGHAPDLPVIIYLCVHVCVHLGAKGRLQVLLLRCCPPCVLRQGLLLASNLLSTLEWLASEPSDLPISVSPVLGFTCVYYYA